MKKEKPKPTAACAHSVGRREVQRMTEQHKAKLESRIKCVTEWLAFGPRTCWIWQGARDRYGYGSVRINGRVCSAHRVAYELYVGPIPKGAIILHACDVRACVNPKHLSVGNHSENLVEAHERGRRAQRRNAASDVDRAAVRRAIRSGKSLSHITERFNISRQTVDAIRDRMRA